MRFKLLIVSGAVVAALASVAGCKNLPSYMQIPGRMGPDLTPDEMRKKYGEGSEYLMEEPGKAAAPKKAPEVVASAPTVRQAAIPAAPVIPADAPLAARYGDLLFISGQLPVDARGNSAPPDSRIEDQTRMAMDNVRFALQANSLTMANIVSMTVYLKDLNDVSGFDTVYASYFKGGLMPARSVVEVSRLPRNARVEISAVAGR